MPDTLREARDRVARDFDLDPDWLNAGPTDILKWGLPDGFMSRPITRRYGSALMVHFAGRFDQVHFKLFAMVDQAGGRHETDLRAPMTQDPSPGYKMVL